MEFHNDPFLGLCHSYYIPQAVDCELFLYADDTCFLYQHNYLEWIKEGVTKNLSNICDWSVDNKLNIHFGHEKTEVRGRNKAFLYCPLKLKT